jgi:hypothetical protein
MPISIAICGSKSKSNAGNYIGTVALPVISSAFGNVMSFSWTYKDNYSAGTSIQRINAKAGDKNTFSWWQTDVPYCDYYGRAYWYDFSLVKSFDGGLTFANNPSGNVPAPNDLNTLIIPPVCSSFKSKVSPYMLRKDSREALNFNYQIELVSNRQELIIGSNLASMCELVTSIEQRRSPKLYYIPSSVGAKFNEYVMNIKDVNGIELSSVEFLVTNALSINVSLIPDFTSWCIAFDTEKTTNTYSDEDGNEIPITTTTGGEILLICNKSKAEYGTQTTDTIYFTPTKTNLIGG